MTSTIDLYFRATIDVFCYDDADFARESEVWLWRFCEDGAADRLDFDAALLELSLVSLLCLRSYGGGGVVGALFDFSRLGAALIGILERWSKGELMRRPLVPYDDNDNMDDDNNMDDDSEQSSLRRQLVRHSVINSLSLLTLVRAKTLQAPTPSAPPRILPAPSASPPILPAPSAPPPILPAPSAPPPILPALSAPPPNLPAPSAPSPILAAPSAPPPILPAPSAPPPILPASSAPSPILPAPSAPPPILPAPSVGTASLWIEYLNSVWATTKRRHLSGSFVAAQLRCFVAENFVALKSRLDADGFVARVLSDSWTRILYLKLWRRTIKNSVASRPIADPKTAHNDNNNPSSLLSSSTDYETTRSILKLLRSWVASVGGDVSGSISHLSVALADLTAASAKISAIPFGFAGNRGRKSADASPLKRLFVLTGIEIAAAIGDGHGGERRESHDLGRHFVETYLSSLLDLVAPFPSHECDFKNQRETATVLVREFSENDADLIFLFRSALNYARCGAARNGVAIPSVHSRLDPSVLFSEFFLSVNFDCNLLLDWTISYETQFSHWLADWLEWIVDSGPHDSFDHLDAVFRGAERNVAVGDACISGADLVLETTPDRVFSSIGLLGLKLEGCLERRAIPEGRGFAEILRKIERVEVSYEEWKGKFFVDMNKSTE